MAEEKIYRLASAQLIYTPGMLRYWKHWYPTNPNKMFWQMAMGFSMLPAALIADVLSGRCPYEVVDEAVVIKWAEPMGEWKDYHNDPEEVLDGD